MYFILKTFKQHDYIFEVLFLEQKQSNLFETIFGFV